MPEYSAIFDLLAITYEQSQVGKTGRGMRDVQPTIEELIEAWEALHGRSLEGEDYDRAMRELASADGRILDLEWDHPRFRTRIHKVRLPPGREADFYRWLGRPSPTQNRETWAALFHEAMPTHPSPSWQAFCRDRAHRALSWQSMYPFRITDFNKGRYLLDLTRKLLDWRGRRLIRYVSFQLAADSKRLEKWRDWLETLLRESSGGAIQDFGNHGLLPMPTKAEFHGPLVANFADGREVDYTGFLDRSILSRDDLLQAIRLFSTATRCLTVENQTPFQALVQLHTDTLLIWTSFPNEATIALLRRLPPGMEIWHHGDTDPAGYDILRDLRRKSGREIRALQMHYEPGDSSLRLTPRERTRVEKLAGDKLLADCHADLQAMLHTGLKGDFEQERFSEPVDSQWPFFK